MKTNFKKIIFLAGTLCLSTTSSAISLPTKLPDPNPYVCITHAQLSSVHGSNQLPIVKASLSCQAVSRFQSGLKVSSIVLSGAGIWAACSGIGLPASVWLEGGSLGIEIINLSVGLLPCDEKQSKEAVRKMAKEAICEELQRNGVECRE